MARSVQKTFGAKSSGSGDGSGGSERELFRQAEWTVRDRNERAFKNLVEMQGREIKMLESERTWIEKERARDFSVMNQKELNAINLRHDRLQHEMERKHNSFLGKLHRVFGGHKHQQKQIDRLNNNRNREVTERTKQHVMQEAQRQRSWNERHLRVEKDLREATERHAADRDQFRQQREQGFDLAVAKEVNRLRQVPKQRM